MWPSESLASRIYDAANWGLIAGLVVGVISTVLIVWMGNVKEGYLRKDLGDAGERAGRAEQAAGEANLRAANAEAGNLKLGINLQNAESESKRRQTELEIEQRKTAEAQSKAAEAQLVLKQHIEEAAASRRIVRSDRNGDYKLRFARFLEVAKYAGTLALIQSVPDAEPHRLAEDIGFRLKEAGWNVEFMDEEHSHIPARFIQDGVQVLTLETSPFPKGSRPEVDLTLPKDSAAGFAARAAVNLFTLDLGPPNGPEFFGIHWEAAYAEKQVISPLINNGFNFPDGAVVILVGVKPAEVTWPSSLFPKLCLKLSRNRNNKDTKPESKLHHYRLDLSVDSLDNP